MSFYLQVSDAYWFPNLLIRKSYLNTTGKMDLRMQCIYNVSSMYNNQCA